MNELIDRLRNRALNNDQKRIAGAKGNGGYRA